MPRGGLPIQFRPRVVMVAKTLSGQTQYTTIQAAINYAVTQTPSATALWTVEVFPGVYTEQITMAAFVDVKAVGAAEDTIVRQADGTVVILASNSIIEDLTIDLNAPTLARNMIIDNGVAVSNVVIKNCKLTITTPGALNNHVFQLTAASQVVIDSTRTIDAGIGGSGSNIMVYNDTAGATVTLLNNSWVHNNSNAYHLASSVAGTWKAMGNSFSGNGRVTNAWSLGTYLGSGNSYRTTGATQFANISGGSFCEKSAPEVYDVYNGMLVQHAITAAAADTPSPATATPYTVRIHAGVYTETVTAAQWVNLVGDGEEAVTIQMVDARVLNLVSNILVQGLTLQETSAAASAILLYDGGSPKTGVTLRNVRINIDATGNSFSMIYCDGGSTILFEGCRASMAGSGNHRILGVVTAGSGTITLRNCNFTNNSTSTSSSVILLSIAGATIVLENTTLSGNTSAHIRCSAGIVSLRNTQYYSLVRTGTGAIIDNSPYPAPAGLRVTGRRWELAAIANQNIATRTAVGGTITLGGTGQVGFRINDNAADAAGTEQAADAAGTLASTWTPAFAPRYVMPVSVNAFRATTSMFFGLRAALGAAVPGAAEHHAGFIWDGTNFKASSSNGAGVGQTTNLTTPSTGVHHVLEVIVVGGVRVEWYVDRALVLSYSTAAGVPTAALYFQEYEISTGAGGATTSDITLREGFIQECLS